MNPFRSIKGKLILFGLSISLIPIAIIISIYYLHVKSILKYQVTERLKAVAESREQHILAFMERAKVRVIDFSTDGYIRTKVETIVSKGDSQREIAISLDRHLLENKMSLRRYLIAIFVVDKYGKVISSSNKKLIGMDMSDQDIFQQGIGKRYGEAYVGQPHYASILSQNYICVSAPIISKQNPKALGLVVNVYQLATLNEITTNWVGMGKTGEVYLVNKDKIMLSESRFIENALLRQVVDTEPIHKIIKNGEEMVGVYKNYRGVSVAGASMYMPEYGWTLLAEMDKSEAFAPIKALSVIISIFWIVIAGTVAVFGIIYAVSMTRPIEELTHATERFSKGELDYRIKATSKDEIGILASRFNIMAEHLENETKRQKSLSDAMRKSEASLVEIKSRLEYLLTNNPAVIYSSKPSDDYGATFISSNIKTLMGYEPNEFIENPSFWIDHIHPEDVSRILDEVKYGIEKGSHVLEYRFKHKDGTYRWIYDEMRLIHGSDGKPEEVIGFWIDTTKQKHIEDEVKNVARFPSENPNPVLRVAKDGTILYANISCSSFLHDWKCEIGKSVPDFIFQIIKEAFNTRLIIRGAEIKHRDKTFSFTVVPVPDTNYVNLYGTDVTELKRVEKELRILNESLERRVAERIAELAKVNEKLRLEIKERKLVENTLRKSEASLANAQRIAHLGNWKWDIVKNELQWSDEIYRIFGLIPQTFGATYDAFLDFVHPDDREFLKKSVNEALFERKPYSIDCRIILPNGEVHVVHGEAEVVFDDTGRAIQMNGTVQDITERKRAEEALRKSESKYRLLLENLPQRVFYKDKNSTYVSCNENFAKDLHIKVNEIFGKTDYDFFPKELADKYRDRDKKVIESGQKIDTEQEYIMNGKESFIHMIKTPVKDEEGHTIGILGSYLDITEKIVLQKEVERSKHLASLGELAAGVAHEINNPVTGVINCAQILFNKSQEGSREKDLATRIMNDGDRIARIVHSLLSFARPDSKEKKGIASVDEILSDTLILTGAQLQKDGIKLKVNIPQGLPEINANEQLIQQVFLNAINNARYALNQKYPGTHDNKILDISGEEVMMNNGPSIKITFYDHGTGIPALIRDKVMNPFFTTKPTGKGTGLGLSISHSVIRDHGGKLMIDSVEGEFTKVSVILPVRIALKSV